MKTSPTSIRATLRSLRRLLGYAVALAALGLFAKPTAQANGTAYYLDLNGTTAKFYNTLPSGTYNLDGITAPAALWSNSSGGTAPTAALSDNRQLTFGNASTDFAGSTLTLSYSGSKPFLGITVNSTSANITLSGQANLYQNGAQTWSVAAGSTLTEAIAYQNLGLNFGGFPLLLTGGGTLNFGTCVGWASGALSNGKVTEDGTGLVVNLKAGGAPHDGFGAGFTLVNGTLNFATATSYDAFKDFTLPAKPFALNGGFLNNTSGSAMTLTVGAGGYSIGGDFTFTGSSSLNFGSAPVVLAGTPGNHQITVVANSLTIGGAISGSGFGLTKSGNGLLMLNGANTYDGLTTISAGTFGGSGTLAGAATFNSGSKAVFTVTPGGAIGNNSSAMKISGAMTFNANEVHLNLPANLPGGTYALAYSDVTPAANGAFPTPVVDSGTYASDVTSATITLDTVTKQLVLTAVSPFNGPVQLVITQVNGGTNPTAGTPFDVVVQAQNGSGVATNVLTHTLVNLSLNTGSGTLVALSSVFPPGQKQATFTGVTYSKAQDGVVLEATVAPGGDSLTSGLSTAITVNPAAVSASTSTVVPHPNGVPADGITPIAVTVTLWDDFGNPISGKSVALASDRGPSTDTILPALGTSNASGLVTFTVTSVTPGAATLSATVDPGAANLLLASSPVTFTTVSPYLVVGEKQLNVSDVAPSPGPPSPINVVSGDLLEMPGIFTTGGGGFSQPEPWLHNGLFTDDNQLYQKNDSNPLVMTYVLNLRSHPQGYDIKEIRMFSNPYPERSGQSYDILYSLVTAPDTFLLLGTVLTPVGEYGTLMTRTYDNRAGTTPDAGPAILTGVAQIRFNFRIVGQYGVIWREFDVTGTGLGGATHNISGKVTFGGSGLSGVSVSDGTRTATSALDGSYSITGVPDGSYTVTPTLNGFSFTQPSASVTMNGADVTTGMDFSAISALPYDIWKIGTFAHPFNDTLPGSDPDGDGLSNFQEFAFGLDPTSGASSSPITQQFDKTTGTFKYTRWKTSGLAYVYQSSTTLSGSWNDIAPDSAVSNNATPVEEITVTVPPPLLENARLFLRVKAE